MRKITGAPMPARAQRLDDVAAVGVRQADVDDQGVRLGVADAAEQLGRGRGGLDREALLAQPAADERAQLGVVLQHEHAWLDHGPLGG